MRDDLLLYYERELTFLRQMGAQFAEKYPKIASRLVLEPDKCEDPHVERLLEAFAFLAARVHLKIDDEFPEITEALLSIVYPHYIRPIPSMSVVEFQVVRSRKSSNRHRAEDRQAGALLAPVAGVPCKFRTCYDLTFWPLEVTEAEWKTPDRLQPAIKAAEAVAALRVELRCWNEVNFAQLDLKSLRFFLERREQPGAHALRAAVQQLPADPGARPHARLPRPALEPPSRFAAPGGLRRRRRHAAVRAPLVRGLPAAAGVLHVSGQVLLSGPRTASGLAAAGFKAGASRSCS